MEEARYLAGAKRVRGTLEGPEQHMLRPHKRATPTQACSTFATLQDHNLQVHKYVYILVRLYPNLPHVAI